MVIIDSWGNPKNLREESLVMVAKVVTERLLPRASRLGLWSQIKLGGVEEAGALSKD